MFNSKPPKTPHYFNDKNIDLYHLQFTYLPQMLKYYALKGWTLDSKDLSTNINHLIDFQVGVTIARHHAPNTDHILAQQWEALVYLWAMNQEVNLDRFLEYIKEKTTEETWWTTGNNQKNVREHLATFLNSKNKANEIILAISNQSTHINGMVGLEYMESYGVNLWGTKFGDTPRERTINYLEFLVIKFKNYKLVYEEPYEPEMNVEDILKLYVSSIT